MQLSVYLHQEYYDYLRCYGDIDEITNKILRMLSTSDIDVEAMPNAPNRQGAKRLNINVTTEWYLEEVKARPINSPLYSLRKILYYVVDNELPAEWGWKVVNNYKSKKESQILKHLDSAISSVAHAALLVSAEIKEQLTNIEEQIKYIRRMYQ